MILAAGLGTRLRPLTDHTPKALVQVDGHPLLELVIQRLVNSGFTDLLVNVHHFSNQVIDFLQTRDFGANIQLSDETDLLLDTGGALKKAAWFFDEPVLIHNVDILSNIDLKAVYDFNAKHADNLATMVVKERPTSRSLLINDQNLLCGWRNNQTGETRLSRDENNLKPIAFSGIHIVNPSFIERITETGVFSVIDVYLRLAREHSIGIYRDDQAAWIDLGRKESLTQAALLYKKWK